MDIISKDSSTKLTTSSEVATVNRQHVKRGVYDKPIEILIDGSWTPSYMSNVLPGEFWQMLDSNGSVNPDRVFQCLTKPKVLNNFDRRGDLADPNIVMGVSQIATKPQIKEARELQLEHVKHALENPTINHTTLRIGILNNDVTDVEFKD